MRPAAPLAESEPPAHSIRASHLHAHRTALRPADRSLSALLRVAVLWRGGADRAALLQHAQRQRTAIEARDLDARRSSTTRRPIAAPRRLLCASLPPRTVAEPRLVLLSPCSAAQTPIHTAPRDERRARHPRTGSISATGARCSPKASGSGSASHEGCNADCSRLVVVVCSSCGACATSARNIVEQRRGARKLQSDESGSERKLRSGKPRIQHALLVQRACDNHAATLRSLHGSLQSSTMGRSSAGSARQ